MKGYVTVALIAASGKTVEERVCPDHIPLRETIGDLVREAAERAEPLEIWLLLHDHAPVADDEGCDCDTYLRAEPAPYCTFNHEEAPA